MCMLLCYPTIYILVLILHLLFFLISLFLVFVLVFFFFFQAEDGIRDGHVTGVQTCALPICSPVSCTRRRASSPDPPSGRIAITATFRSAASGSSRRSHSRSHGLYGTCSTSKRRVRSASASSPKIGRASCRERV